VRVTVDPISKLSDWRFQYNTICIHNIIWKSCKCIIIQFHVDGRYVWWYYYTIFEIESKICRAQFTIGPGVRLKKFAKSSPHRLKIRKHREIDPSVKQISNTIYIVFSVIIGPLRPIHCSSREIHRGANYCKSVVVVVLKTVSSQIGSTSTFCFQSMLSSISLSRLPCAGMIEINNGIEPFKRLFFWRNCIALCKVHCSKPVFIIQSIFYFLNFYVYCF